MCKSQPTMDDWVFHPESKTYHTRVDWKSQEPLSTTVISAVAAITGIEPTRLEPLYQRVDPDALDSLFRPREETERTGCSLSFVLAGCEVTVHGRGEIVIQPPQAS